MGTALKTLTGVQVRLKTVKPVLDQNVEVRIRYFASAPYVGQRVNWNYYSPNYTITFMPSDYQIGGGVTTIAGRPVFDGNGLNDWWFDAGGRRPAHQPSLLLSSGSELHPGGLRFRGDHHWSGWNGYNTVFGCYFHKLGNYYNSSSSKGYGGVDLVNSDHNLIQNRG